MGKTMAEMSADEKNQISHRGAAIRALAKTLASWQSKEKNNADK